MIQQITPLTAPPQPSDSPTDFDQKAFALLGGLPQFVDQANALGGQIFTIGEDATESAAAALTSKNAAATSASNSAASASASSQSASNSASSANAANQSRIEAQNAAASAAASAASVDSAYLRNRANHTGTQAIGTVSGLQAALDAKASSASVTQAIAMAATFTVVPATYQAFLIVVTLPHVRLMQWNGVKYVRSPIGQMPGVMFHSDGPAANITHAIQVRSDVVYNTADHPDLATFYGFTGSTFVLKDGRSRVLRGADNGRGIDTALVNGYLQEDAIRNITGSISTVSKTAIFEDADGVFTGASPDKYANLTALRVEAEAAVYPKVLNFAASTQVPTATENRVKSLTATLYITR